MFNEFISQRFEKTTPIFAEEILDLFSNYSKQYVYRMIKKAVEEGYLKTFDRGIYYIPQKTFFGCSSIDSDQVAEKKYERDGDSVFGLCSGLSLLNSFGVTDQVPNVIEIVTNNEATRKRAVRISDRTYLLRKSRCQITKENYASYTVLQLFLDMDDRDRIDESVLMRLKSFINENGVALKDLVAMSSFFPGKAVKRMMRSPLFYDAI